MDQCRPVVAVLDRNRKQTGMTEPCRLLVCLSNARPVGPISRRPTVGRSVYSIHTVNRR